jgi:hypothetical protein
MDAPVYDPAALRRRLLLELFYCLIHPFPSHS